MLRLKNKKKVYFYIFLIITLTSITNNNLNVILKNYFLINDIRFSFDELANNEIVSSNMNFLMNKNIFLIRKSEVTNKLKNFDFLENIKIKKKFPATIILEADKTEVIAITYIDQNKYYIGSNGKFISASKIESKKKNIPIIFGKFETSDFMSLLDKLKIKKINTIKNKKFYYHKNKRWDLYFENNSLIKLPENRIEEAIDLYVDFSNQNKIESNSIIDLRIPERIVLNNAKN